MKATSSVAAQISELRLVRVLALGLLVPVSAPVGSVPSPEQPIMVNRPGALRQTFGQISSLSRVRQ